MDSKNIDDAFDCLKKIIELAEKSFSEADTRAKLIDPMFKDCLNWEEKNITREQPIRPGFLDYVFSVDGIKKFVVEAKKTGKYFTIPSSLNQRSYKIRGTITTDDNIKNAIEQAQKYCIDSGIRYGIITNGKQYIIFEAFRYGQSWKDSYCTVFHSLEDIQKNFTIFSNILRKESVRNGSLKEHISRRPFIVKYEKPLDKVHYPDSTLIRNYLTPLLQPIIENIFMDITDDSQLEILKNCYVFERQFRKSTNSLLGSRFDRLPHFAEKFHIEQLKETGADAGAFQTSFEKCQKFLRYDVPKGTLVTLLGGVGTGKTTFIHHFFKFTLKNPKILWFYVDFKESFPDPKAIIEYIFQSIVKNYEDRYFHKLKKELEDFGWGKIPNPNEEDLVCLFSILNARGYILSLVLDNVDRHYLTIPKFQEQVLLVARNLTNTLKTISILTLREESFFKSIKSGVLDAYNIPKFHISTPYFDRLISRRIDYTLELLEKTDEEIIKTIKTYHPLQGAQKELVIIFFEVLKSSLRRSRKVGQEILKFLCDVSGGNMREALRFVNMYCVSGNTNTEEMYSVYNRLGFYEIPFHHVIKSIMLGDSKYYKTTRSDVMNLFDLNPTVTNSHFLHLNVLNYLKDRINYFSTLERGYIEITDLINEGERVSISPRAVEYSLSSLAYFGLVEFDNQSRTDVKKATHVRITATGEHYIEKLIHRFVYLDLVWMDTPVNDLNTVNELRGLINSSDMKQRFQRTELFLNYLWDCEEKEFKNNPEYRESDLTRTKFVEDIINKYELEKKYILKKRYKSSYKFSR